MVAYEENGVDAQSVDYARLVALLIEGMKEQQRQVEEKETEIEMLKKQVAELQQTRAEVENLKAAVAQISFVLEKSGQTSISITRRKN